MEDFENIDYKEAFNYKEILEMEKRAIELSTEIPKILEKLKALEITYPGILDEENEIEYSKPSLISWAIGTPLQRRDNIVLELESKATELTKLKKLIDKISNDITKNILVVEDIEMKPMINERSCKDPTKLPFDVIRECWKKGFISMNEYVGIGLSRSSKNMDWGKTKKLKKSKKPKKNSRRY